MARPPRLPDFDYIGPHAICFTTCTRSRHHAFLDADVARFAVDQILQIAAAFEIELAAYCVMPDHAHALAIGVHEQSEPLTALVRWKRNMGYWYRQRTGEYLWQPGYWDRVLRDEDDVLEAVRYIVANPLRAGLVTDLTKYPWVGRFALDDSGACASISGL
jgi:putative transposase